MKNYKIFYSWQSDLEKNTNHYLIKDAISEANKELKKENYNIELDHDTKNIPGSPEIINVILDKINQADIFVADLSLIYKTEYKGFPNPNVLIELGYALTKLGSERVLQIMNTFYGEPNLLPFDLKHRRHPTTYNLNPNANKEEIKKVKDSIKEQLKYYIKLILDSAPKKQEASLTQTMISKIDIYNMIYNSDPALDWTRDHGRKEEITYFNKNVNLRFQIEDDEFGGTFTEPWTNSFPDPNAQRCNVCLFYNNTRIADFLLVSVDGHRARLPLPQSIEKLKVDPFEYKIAKIMDITGLLDEYMFKYGKKFEILKKSEYPITVL